MMPDCQAQSHPLSPTRHHWNAFSEQLSELCQRASERKRPGKVISFRRGRALSMARREEPPPLATTAGVPRRVLRVKPGEQSAFMVASPSSSVHISADIAGLMGKRNQWAIWTWSFSQFSE